MASVNNYALVETPFSHTPSAVGNHVSTLTYLAGCTHVPTINLGTGNPSVNALTLTTAKSGLVSANDAKYMTCIWALTGITCGTNNITTLDVSENKSLNILYCNTNSITTLNVTANTRLTDLSCHANALTTLDVSANNGLVNLRCYANSITALDVSAKTALILVHAYDNSMTTLDVSGCTALKTLWIQSNSFTALSVTNAALTDFRCQSNALNDAAIDSLVAGLDSVAWTTVGRVLNISDMANASDINTGTTCTSLGNLASEGWVITYEQGTCTV